LRSICCCSEPASTGLTTCAKASDSPQQHTQAATTKALEFDKGTHRIRRKSTGMDFSENTVNMDIQSTDSLLSQWFLGT
jgi:hypothetical protein